MTTRDQFLDELRQHVGYVESKNNDNKFAKIAGHANYQPWCATLLVACAKNVGLSLPSQSAYTPTLASGFSAARQFYADPQVGDLVFFDFVDDVHRIQHVGVVEKVEINHIVTIEGNTSSGNVGSQANGGGCYRRHRPRNNTIVGYGRPVFTTTSGKVVVPEPAALPTIQGPVELHIIQKDGFATGYYLFSPTSGELHAYGEGAKFYGRSQVVMK